MGKRPRWQKGALKRASQVKLGGWGRPALTVLFFTLSSLISDK
jgi:hypothetical protein